MKPIVYLAGPIAGTNRDESVAWRKMASAMLAERGLESLSPMRCKDALTDSAVISRDYKDYEKRGIFYTSRGIMARDHSDVRRADALLVNLLGARNLSPGTIMELAWAYDRQKPAVVAMEAKGNPHDRHPMIHEATAFRVDSLEDAIDAVAIVLGR